MARPAAITESDLALLARSSWEAPEDDRRSLRLARLGLCRSRTRTNVQPPDGGPPFVRVTWATTDKGALLSRCPALPAEPPGDTLPPPPRLLV